MIENDAQQNNIEQYISKKKKNSACFCGKPLHFSDFLL